jgi:hypothetical protein
MLNLDQAKRQACKDGRTLDEALVWIAVWESERIVRQARESSTWDTCFEHCFTAVREYYQQLHSWSV